MKLGIYVTTTRHLNDIIGITKAAVSKGHEVTIFTMDDGVKLLENPTYTALCKVTGVSMAYCDHNATGKGINKTVIPSEIVCGSQFNNATMFHESDRIISL